MADTNSKYVAIGNTGLFESGFVADSFEQVVNFIQPDAETPFSVSISQNGAVTCKFGPSENDGAYQIRKVQDEDAAAIDPSVDDGLTFAKIKELFDRADPAVAAIAADGSKQDTVAFNSSAIAQELKRGCRLYNPFACTYVRSNSDDASVTIANVSLDSVARYLGEQDTTPNRGTDLLDRVPSTVIGIDRNVSEGRLAAIAEDLANSPGAFASLSPVAISCAFEAYGRPEDALAFGDAVGKHAVDSLQAWFAGVDADVMGRSADWPPCWGGCMRVSDRGDYVPIDDFEAILPSEHDRNLYLALCYSPEAGGAGDIPIADICRNIDDDVWLAEVAALQVECYSTVFYTEASPDDFTDEELAELSVEKPGLFSEEHLRTWPLLAEALRSKRPNPSQIAVAAASCASKQVGGEEKASVIRSV